MDAAWWAVAAAWVTATFIGVGLRFTYVQVKEAQRLREEQARPWVVVDFDTPHKGWLVDLTVQNVGRTAAKNVKLAIDPPPVQYASSREEGQALAQSFLLQRGIPVLPPGKTVRTFFDSLMDRAESGYPTEYAVTVDYEDGLGRPLPTDRFVLDLGLYMDLVTIDLKDQHNIAESLDEMQKEMAKWTQGFTRR